MLPKGQDTSPAGTSHSGGCALLILRWQSHGEEWERTQKIPLSINWVLAQSFLNPVKFHRDLDYRNGVICEDLKFHLAV